MTVLVRPIITERSLKQVKDFNKYTFRVGRNVNKFQIKQAVQDLYSVKVKDIRTKVSIGKTKRHGKTKKEAQAPDSKYAIVKLDPKDKIEVFEIKEKTMKKSKTKKKEQK